jgi:hypothetical protein
MMEDTAERPTGREGRVTRQIEVLGMIQEDMESDTKMLEGQTVTGRVIAAEFGKTRATIQALARIVSEHIEAELERSKTL